MGGLSAGCGGSSKKSTSPTDQIKQDWAMFFAGSTPVSKKIQLLQNGQRFAQLIQAQASSPLAQQAQVTVTNVVLESPTRAKVTYTILLAGKPALPNQTGTAVRSGGVWQVSDQSFCSLLSLEGAAPPACRGA
jgi:hypothetical protein